jgi:hypothetical protein
MKKLEKCTSKWWFFVLLFVGQCVLMPIVSRNFDPQNVPGIIRTTLANAPQVHLGNLNILFQTLSLVMFILLFVFKNKFRTVFNAYVAISYLAFAFIQNMAVTEQYGFSVITVNVVMFLFVAYTWLRETLEAGKRSYGLRRISVRKYAWMIVLALFAYWCPFNNAGPIGLQSPALLHPQHGHGLLPDDPGLPDHSHPESPQGQYCLLPDYRHHRLPHRHLQHVQLPQPQHCLGRLPPPPARHHLAVLCEF